MSGIGFLRKKAEKYKNEISKNSDAQIRSNTKNADNGIDHDHNIPENLDKAEDIIEMDHMPKRYLCLTFISIS